MLRRRGISVACIQITRPLFGRGASCHERLVRVTNGVTGDTSAGRAGNADQSSTVPGQRRNADLEQR